ncbi:murein transglycosylase A [Tardiphaga sp. 839_C3_N1_4]|uniref:murein transglycosylase A n=1 Tax=Tardiphaga sp. 839_C3_N1_4 TaxID=3240761 RepID=UPI003F27744D
MAPAACNNAARLGRLAALCVIAAALVPAPADARVRRYAKHVKNEPAQFVYVPRHNPPREWPFEFTGSQYEPVAWANIAGWSEDDHLLAFQAFRTSCKPIVAQRKAPPDSKALGTTLRDPCRAARTAEISDGAKARAFFEDHFQPLRISRLGEPEGFVTGYYEPVIDGSRTKTDVYTVPVYRRPSNLFVRGYRQSSASMPNGGDVFRKIGRRKLVPYYDRGEIEDGAIAGRGLEIVWLKSQIDLLFTQIQGSARVRLEDGGTVRINYDAHNGYRYTPVGRVLIDRGIIPREQMSMQRIRQYMDENPDAASELRRQNRSYVFFREVQLSDKDEAVGAQGVPLTPGRSIAVDKSLHVYGTPFFIEGDLPVDSDTAKTPFRRLMVAQDTGSAIIGPARADLYFGAGAEAGRVAGRMRHPARFVMLVPKSLDPSARGHHMPLPDARPSERIAKLFPQTEPKPAEASKVENSATDNKAAAKPDTSKSDTSVASKPVAPTVTATRPLPVAKPAVAAVAPAPTSSPSVATTVPLPEARPAVAPQVAAEAKSQKKPEVKPEVKREVKPKRAKVRHRVYRRAAKQPQSLFRFPWQ